MDPTVLPDRAGGGHSEASLVGGTTDYSRCCAGDPRFIGSCSPRWRFS